MNEAPGAKGDQATCDYTHGDAYTDEYTYHLFGVLWCTWGGLDGALCRAIAIREGEQCHV